MGNMIQPKGGKNDVKVVPNVGKSGYVFTSMHSP